MYYVIYGNSNGFYDIAYKDIVDLPNVEYYRGICFENKFLNFILRIHLSKKVNGIIELPFKKCWYKLLYYNIKKKPKDEDKLCFLFFSRLIEDDFSRNYLLYLKDRFPRAKYVCYFHDILDSHININIENIKEIFDLVLTYDYNDSIKYNLIYHPTPYCFVSIEKNKKYESDIYFVGKAKTRMQTIVSAYDKFEQKGFKCLFFIVDCNLKEYPIRNGIRYIETMSYIENLKYVRNSKCVLEINQEGAIGMTPRTWEAIMYDKYLITNNIYIKNTPFFVGKYMKIYCDNIDIDLDLNKNISYPCKLKLLLSPINLINKIEYNFLHSY